ncbi:MAG: amidohydrolase family protein [Pseudomonadota bacterium]
MLQRRRFLGAAISSAFIQGSFSLPLSAAENSAAEPYDLVIRGGRVIDPSQQLDMIADVGISNGQIAMISSAIPDDAAIDSIDARGLLVVPGLIDVHVHARDAELPPADFLASGVTTMVDAGSRGAGNIDSIIQIAEQAPNRLRMMLNVAELGNNPGGRSEFLDGIAPADVGKARAAVEQHREWIVGIKARLSRGVSAELDYEVLSRAVQVAEPFGIPVMIHIGDTFTPLPRLLELLRPGDIVTHMYVPTPNGILDAKGRLLPEVIAARANGVRFDFGNGLNEHWSWDVAEKAFAQGFLPDTISSDLNVPGRIAQVFDLPNVMSKFFVLGMSLDEVIACVTKNAAQTFRELNGYGSLKPGAAADITVLESTAGEFEFVDNYKNSRSGVQKLVTKAVVMGGTRFI